MSIHVCTTKLSLSHFTVGNHVIFYIDFRTERVRTLVIFSLTLNAFSYGEVQIPYRFCSKPLFKTGWSGGAMMLGKLPVPGRPTSWIIVGQGPTALVVGAGGGCLDVFTLTYPFLFSFSLSLGDGPI